MNSQDYISPIPSWVQCIADLLREKNRTLASIESCTGGMVAGAITELAGISDVYLGGFVTYSNMAKQIAVGVNQETLARYGAVSSQVAIEMAKGGYGKLQATNAIAITGVAGPTGGTQDKPLGTVWICVAQSDGKYDCLRFIFPGDRQEVRMQSLKAALTMCIGQLVGGFGEFDYLQEHLTA